MIRSPGGGVLAWGLGESPLGPIRVAWSSLGLVACGWDEDPAAITRELDSPAHLARERDDEAARSWVRALAAYWTPGGLDPSIRLDLWGTPFQRSVWRALREIRPGQRITYASLAQGLGRPGAARAVGAACGANRLALVVPCHRVIDKAGQPRGYRWGIERKRALLAWERAVAAGSPPPAIPRAGFT